MTNQRMVGIACEDSGEVFADATMEIAMELVEKNALVVCDTTKDNGEVTCLYVRPTRPEHIDNKGWFDYEKLTLVDGVEIW